jgi:hypothetical protein
MKAFIVETAAKATAETLSAERFPFRIASIRKLKETPLERKPRGFRASFPPLCASASLRLIQVGL